MVATLWLLLVLSGPHGVSVVKFEDEAQCLAAKTVIERNVQEAGYDRNSTRIACEEIVAKG